VYRHAWGDGAIARIIPARPATLRHDQRGSMVFKKRARTYARTHARRTQKFTCGLGEISADPAPGGGGVYSELKAPHRGTSLGPFVCGAYKKSAQGHHRRATQGPAAISPQASKQPPTWPPTSSPPNPCSKPPCSLRPSARGGEREQIKFQGPEQRPMSFGGFC
jgi:hypothetical protein